MPSLEPTLRVAMYAHDTYGLGHITRTLRLARSIVEVLPSSSVLILTGSPVAHCLRFPVGVEYVKLPSVRKFGSGTYAPRNLDIPFRWIRSLRARILRDSLQFFRPHAFFVDNVPTGMKGELVPALEYMAAQKRQGVSIHLNLRDILDDPAALRDEWTASGAYDLLDSIYDEVHVFGSRSIHDSVAEYRLPPERTRFHGYIAPPVARRRVPFDTLQEVSPARVLVTIGGGDDGVENVRCALDVQKLRGEAERMEMDVVLGPLAGSPTRIRLEEQLHGLGGVRVLEFVEHLWHSLGDYDVVLSMGGYNTLCEVMACARRSVVIPRHEPRVEQVLRARALEQRGILRVLDPSERAPERLDEVLRASLREGPVLPSPHTPPLDGLASFQHRVQELAEAVTPGRRNGSGSASAHRRRGKPRRLVPSGHVGVAWLLGMLVLFPGALEASLLPKTSVIEMAGGYDTNILDASDEEVAAFHSGDPGGYFVVQRLADAFVRTSLEGRWKTPGLGNPSQLRLGYTRLQYWNESIRSENRYALLWRNRLSSKTLADVKVEYSPGIYLRHRRDKDALPGDPLYRPEVRTALEAGLSLEQNLAGPWASRVGLEASARDFNRPFDERDRWSIRGWTGLVWKPFRSVKMDLNGGYRRLRSRNEPYLGSDLSYREWNLRSVLECVPFGSLTLRAQVERDWRQYTSNDPDDENHFGREDAEWRLGGTLRTPLQRSLDGTATLVHTRRSASASAMPSDGIDEDGSYRDTVVSAGLVWSWER